MLQQVVDEEGRNWEYIQDMQERIKQVVPIIKQHLEEAQVEQQ